jgi:Raf kinase inhibitor-like YbhB/YbcL family protein
MRRVFHILLFFVIIFISYIMAEAGDDKTKEAHMKLTSPEFANNGFIPAKFTCQGDNVNPALIIEGVPDNTATLALIVDDPDAPARTWVHWVVYNIPVVSRIEENSVPGVQGVNDSAGRDYQGPCPPSGTHRYFFKIYALDAALRLKPGFDKKDLEKAMQGHILDQAELIGLYKKTTVTQ